MSNFPLLLDGKKRSKGNYHARVIDSDLVRGSEGKFNSCKVYSEPVNDNDVATKSYVDASGTLAPALTSIVNASLTANPGDILYTPSTNAYTTSGSTSYGRGVINNTTAQLTRDYLGLTIGTNVQAYDSKLQSISETTGAIDTILYTTAPNIFGATALSSFARSLLDDTDAATARGTLGALGGGGTTEVNKLVRWANDNGTLIKNSSAELDDDGNLTVTGTINGVTGDEFDQIANINSINISNGNWGHVAQLNQNLATTAAPTFDGLTLNDNIAMNNKRITGLPTTHTNATEAVSLGFVQGLASGFGAPFDACNLATTVDLSTVYGSVTYDNVAETLTSGTLDVIELDGSAAILNDRVLIKNQPASPASGNANDATNGIYIVTTVGSVGVTAWELTRAPDFDVGTSITPGRTVFVQNGATQSFTSWTTTDAATVGDIDPVSFTQTGGSGSITAGSALQFTGSTLNVLVDGSTIKVNGSDQLEVLGPLAYAQGGTGTDGSSFTTASRLVATNSLNDALETTSLDPDKVVTLTGAEELTNKTITGGSINGATVTNATITNANNDVRASELGTTGASVEVDTSAPPMSGQVLLATSETTAVWSNVPAGSIERVINVAQSGGDYTTIAAAIAAINGGSVTGGVPTIDNWVVVRVAPGTYLETNPLTIPNYTEISGIGSSYLDTVIEATVTGQPVFVMQSGTALGNLTIEGIVGGNPLNLASAGALINYGSTTNGLAYIQSTYARNCTLGYSAVGNGSTNSSVVLSTKAIAGVTQATVIMDTGFKVTQGSSVQCSLLQISGFFGGTVNNGCVVEGDSLLTINDLQCTFITNGAVVQTGITQRAQLQINSARMSAVGGTPQASALKVGLNAELKASNALVIDNDFFDLLHLNVASSPSPNQSKVSLVGCSLRQDKFSISPNADTVGLILGTVPDEETVQVLSELSVGRYTGGKESIFGQGDSRNEDMIVFTATTEDVATATYVDITSNLIRQNDGNSATLFAGLTQNNCVYFGGDVQMTGLRLDLTTEMVPSQDSVVLEYYDGTGWIQFPYMTVQGRPPYGALQDQLFVVVGRTQLRWSHITDPQNNVIPPSGVTIANYTSTNVFSNTDTTLGNAWTQLAVNGETKYWIRARISDPAGITTEPVATKVKLGTNRVEINDTGYREMYGKGRMARLYHGSVYGGRPTNTGFDGGYNRPAADRNIFFAKDLVRLTVSLNNTDTYAWRFDLDASVDTSAGFDLNLGYSAAAPQTNTIRIGWLTVSQGNAANQSAATLTETANSITVDIEIPAANTFYQTRLRLFDTKAVFPCYNNPTTGPFLVSVQNMAGIDVGNVIFVESLSLFATHWTDGVFVPS